MRSILPLFLCVCFSVLVVSSASCAYAVADSPTPFVAEANRPEGGGSDSDASTGMFDTTAQLGKALISGIWSLFGIYVPGFSFTFGQLWVGVFLASVSILVIRMIFGFGGSGSRGDSPRTSSTNNPKISKERRHDEF